MNKKTKLKGLGQCAEFYFEDCMALGESNSTIHSKRLLLAHFIKWASGCDISTLQQIDMMVMEEYRRHIHRYRKKNGEPLDIATQCARLMAITKFLKCMDYYGYIDGEFARKFRLPRIPRRLPKNIPSVHEIELVLSQSLIMGRLTIRNRAIIETFFCDRYSPD